MATVKLAYTASSNISFRGEIDTGIEQEEWDQMSWQEQDEVIQGELNDLVDIAPVEGK